MRQIYEILHTKIPLQRGLGKNIKKLTAVSAQTVNIKEVNTAIHYYAANIL